MKKRGKNKKLKPLSKLKFLLGLLIIIVGGSLMIDLLGISMKGFTSNVNELVLFPMAMLILIVGIGVVVKNTNLLED